MTSTAETRAIRRSRTTTFVGLPSYDDMVARLTDLIDAAPSSVWSAGLAWYPSFAAIADILAERHGVSFEAAAAALAILSPRCAVATSVFTADAVLGAYTTGGPDAALQVQGVLPANVQRTVDWLEGDRHATDQDTGTTLTRSRKVRSFFANILGDDEPVTVDVWATRAVGATVEQPEGGAYVTIAEAYREVADHFGITPREAQAIAWVATRTDIDAEAELFTISQLVRNTPRPVATTEPAFETVI